jgi:type IV pilus assembly protein PilE
MLGVPRSLSSASRGFTLIELMVTVVIVAILAAVALPAFMSQVRKSRRAEAITSLNQISQAQERWRSNCANYVTTAASLTAAASSVPCAGGLGIAGSTSYYSYGAAPVGGASASVAYAVTATATGAQLKDTRCLTLTLQAASGGVFNYQSTGTGGSPALCWNR